jgi:hypothetical protein
MQMATVRAGGCETYLATRSIARTTAKVTVDPLVYYTRLLVELVLKYSSTK